MLRARDRGDRAVVEEFQTAAGHPAIGIRRIRPGAPRENGRLAVNTGQAQVLVVYREAGALGVVSGACRNPAGPERDRRPGGRPGRQDDGDRRRDRHRGGGPGLDRRLAASPPARSPAPANPAAAGISACRITLAARRRAAGGTVGRRPARPLERAETATPVGSCAPRWADPAAPAGRRAAARRSASAGVSRPRCTSTPSSASSASACASLSLSSTRCVSARSTTSCGPATQPTSRDRAASAILRACRTSGSRRTAPSGDLFKSFSVRSTAHHHPPCRRLAYHGNSVFQ